MISHPVRRAVIRRTLCALSLVSTLTLTVAAARAQSPIGQIISYQGQLSNAGGAPIADGTTSLTFKIYEAGTEKSSQTMSVATFGGVFNTFLSVGALAFDPTKSYELGITFNGSETRHPIAAVPVALSAATAGSVSGVVPIANGGTGSATQPFVDLTTAQTVAGAKTFSSAVTVPQVNIGGNRVLGISLNNNSVFVGTGAGTANGNISYNVLVGAAAGDVTTSGSNVFVGADAGGSNTTGSGNTAIGDFAGGSWTTGSNNIAIKNSGVAGESFTTRIGTKGTQSRAFIAGIRGATGLAGALPVVVDGDGQLGTGSGVTDAASLSGVVPVANGGTGSSTQNFVDLTTNQTIAGAKDFSSAVNSPQYNIGGQRILGVPGSLNTFVGQSTGASNTGSGNTFLGGQAGISNTSAVNNTFLGAQAGFSTTTAINNTFVGAAAGARNTTGQNNTFVGTSGGAFSTTGSANTALGINAGNNWTTGSDNIAINNAGGSGESNTTRIGSGGAQTRAFIAGIRGVAVAGSAVIIDANGQLGTINSSSGRFKQDVHNIGANSDWLLKLRPVSFRYTPQFLKSAAPSPMQYGLIAEEVAKVAPQMVHLDEKGRPDGVDYQNLPVMLLNQVQHQQKLIEELQARLKKLEAGR